MTYRVELTSSAARDLNRIPTRYLGAIVEFVYGPLAGHPKRLGGPLHHELEGSHSARRGAYRILYTVIEDEQTVVVHRVDHRATAYQPR